MNRSVSKSQLAAAYGISLTTLAGLLNERYFEQLAAVGYLKNSIIIPPKVLEAFYAIYGEPITEANEK